MSDKSAVAIVNSTSLSQFLVTLILASIAGTVMFLAWIIMRRMVPRIFYAVPLITRRDKAFKIPSVFRWMIELYRTTGDDIVCEMGYDAHVLIRSYDLALQLFVPIMIMSLGLLLPLNILGSEGGEDLNAFLVTNISDGDSVLWVFCMAAWVFSIYAYLCVNTAYIQLSRLYSQHLLMKSVNAEKNYAVMMTMIRGLRDETRRNDDLNGVRDDDASQLSALLHKPVCDDVASAVRHYKPQRVLTHQVQNWHNEIKELKRALYKWQKSKTGTRPTHRLGFCGLVGEQVDSIEYHNNRVAKYGLAVDEMMTNPDMWVPTDTAFAVMTTMSSVAAATENKYLSAAGANLIAGIIREAPERRDLFWMNVSLNRVSRSSRWLLATVLAIALILLWYIPISFVQSFISMEYLSTKIPWFDSLVDAIPFMRGLLQGFLPLVCLKIFMAALPKICIGLAILEGCRTKSKIDRRSTSTLFYFQLFNVMLGSIAMSTVFTSLSMDVPISIFEMLGDSMPGTSTFFMNYVIVLTFIGTGVELLNMPMLFVSGFLVAFFVKTPVEEEKTIHPDPLEIAKPYAEFLLVMCIGLVFSTVAPIVLPSVVLYMFVCRYVFLNQLRYVYEPAYETGGRAWPLVFSRIMVCIMLFQATICGVLLSKDMVVASAMILPLLVLSIFFWRHLSNRYGHAYKHTPGSIAQRVDERARALALLEMSHAEYTEPEQPVKAVANTRRRSSAGSTDSDIDRPTTSQSTKDNTAVAINQTVRKVSKRDSPLSFYRSTPKSNLEMDSCGRLRLAANNPFARWRNHIPESMEATEVFMPDFDSKVRRKQKDCNWLHQLATATHPPSLHELFSELLKSNTEDSAGISIAECMVRDPREPEVKKFGTAAPDQCSLQSYKEGKTITLQGTIENLKQDKKKVNHPCE